MSSEVSGGIQLSNNFEKTEEIEDHSQSQSNTEIYHL